ncbi:hypothetical protein ACLKMY_37815 [Paraburkholderia mimosarum]|uniref:hypothetical protein n=1 Tax=Paraburkholderia mimosarum TaxID=312026 RepID=UPI0039C1B15D
MTSKKETRQEVAGDGENMRVSSADRSPNHSPAQRLRQRVESAIDRELARCEKCMTPAHWVEHAEWVRDYVVASAREWLRTQAREGAL